MDLDELSRKLKNDGITRTEFFSELTSKLREKNIITSGSDTTIKTDATGSLSEFVVSPTSKDAVLQLDGVNVTIETLKKFGVDDFKLVKPFDPSIDPLSWNVVYKDGGWVING